MSYQEIYEIYVICDQNRCQATLDINCATEEDADEEAAKNGWQCDEDEGIHYCQYHWHVECNDCHATDIDAVNRLAYQGWRIDHDNPKESLCPNHWHLECRECCKCEVGPMHRLEYEGWLTNTDNPKQSLCPECAKGTAI